MFLPKVIIRKSTYHKLLAHVRKTDFQYETGGILLGYKCLRIFYVVAFTFSHHSENTAKMTFILDGVEHTQKMKRIRKKFLFRPQFLGVWHSHTTEDDSFSLQDRKSHRVLVSQFGEIISAIVTRKKEQNKIQIAAYYILKSNRMLACNVSMSI